MQPEQRSSGDRRPPYEPQYGNANFQMICKEAGLESKYASQEFLIQGKGLLSLFELFSDGEITIASLGSPQGQNAEFYKRISVLREKAESQPGSILDKEFNKLARFCGMALAEQVFMGLKLPDVSQVRTGIDEYNNPYINYAGESLVLKSGSIIFDIGPGLAGRKFVELQRDLIKKDGYIQYIPITKGPFINQFLIHYAAQLYDRDPNLKGQFKLVIQNGLYAGREDGMPAALEAILSSPSEKHDIADVMIFNALGRAKGEDLTQGLKIASRLIRPGGHLLIGSPVERVWSQGIGFNEQIELVSDKFKVVKQETKRTGNVALGLTTISSMAILKREV